MAVADRDLQAAIAVTRFGLGARPGELAAVRSDPRGWLLAQIRREGADQPVGREEPLPTTTAAYAVAAQYRAAIRGVRQNARTQDDAKRQSDEEIRARRMARREAALPTRRARRLETAARLEQAISTERGFGERWALFWANHFSVSARKIQFGLLAAPFEREAIRPHVFGRFEDLLVASTAHPGMLYYLDQVESVAPSAAPGRRRRGLNENLAREIMELHTVGADAGYSQADVTEFAQALTGWSVGSGAGENPGAFLFRQSRHQGGDRQIMGRRYASGGEEQARAVLRDLAAHPATSRRVSTKIARHFVADDPPPALVAALDQTWRKTGGDLAAVAETLVKAPEPWDPAPRKFKTPYEFVASSFRAAGAGPEKAPQALKPLETLGQRLFLPPQPDGWSDFASDWAAPDALVKRLAWSRSFAAVHAPTDSPSEVAQQALGARLGRASAAAVARAESRSEAFALLLMSPEFQRR